MNWLNPNDPRSAASVVAGKWCAEPLHPDQTLPEDLPPDFTDEAEETAIMALNIASDMLFRLSGYTIHPAGFAEDDFRCSPLTHRLTPNFRPVQSVTDIYRLLDDYTLDLVPEGAYVWQQEVYFSRSRCSLATYYTDICKCAPGNTELIRLRYKFGSTVTPAARRAVLYLAHQLWLECNPDAGECQLPERTTSVNREGLSYTIFDPQTYLQQGKTGLPSVDLWLSTVNGSKALRPAGVWTPDSAPGVNTSVIWDWARVLV